MKKISIQKNGVITNQVELENAAADSWLASHIAMGTFGNPDLFQDQPVLITPAVYEDDVLITPAVYQMEDYVSQEEVLDETDGVTVLVPEIISQRQVLVSVLVTPAEYTVIEEDSTAAVARQILIEDKIKKGQAAKQACENVLNLIGGFNIDRELTFAQKNEMKTLFADAKNALNDFQPGYAKYFINLLTPDGILLTQEMKDLCIELLAGY